MTYVFLANGFEKMEALTTVDLLRRANVPVQTVGVGGKQIMGSHQIPVIADTEEHEVTLEDLKMAVLPGGLSGALNLEQSETVKNAMKGCFESDRYVAAIYAAPSTLGHMGLFQGKCATVSDGSQSEIIGAEYTGDLVTVDSRIITGKGPMASVGFVLQLVDLLAERETAQKVRSAVQCWRKCRKLEAAGCNKGHPLQAKTLYYLRRYLYE